MAQALASTFPQPTRGILAAVLLGRRRPRNPFARRDWLRVSQRLACGMSKDAVARAEGTAPETVDRLLREPDFQGLVESFKELLAEPPERHRARLVRLARIALENALTDWDVGAALFVLDQDERGNDPAETLADAVLAQARRPAAAIPPGQGAPAPAAAPASPAGPRRYDALGGLTRRGAAGLRAAVLAEHALQRAASATPAAPTVSEATPPGAPRPSGLTTADAARHALALRQAAASPGKGGAASPSPASRLARRLGGGAAGMALLPADSLEPAATRQHLARLPRRPRGP
jgi:hypothetical protein